MKITANMVTMARIVMLPIPCAIILWGDERALWFAFGLGTLLGATDFIDGYMARRDGPTVLGSLLDPVADKVFVAALLLPIAAIGDCPAWVAGLVFVRELLITALRSSMAVRKEQLKTSQLGKLKTVVQMGGLGTYFLTLAVPGRAMTIVHLCGFLGLLAFGAFYWWRKKKRPPVWLLGAAPLWLFVVVISTQVDPHTAVYWQFVIMVAFTWISGFDYLVGASALLRKSGLTRVDVSRLVWAASVGFCTAIVVDDFPAAVLPLLVAMAAELSLGGIDNVVAAERGRFCRASFVPSTILALAVAASAFLGRAVGVDAQTAVMATSVALAVVSVANAVFAYVADKTVFQAERR